ncbi:MAG TPA: hypothetical protein VFM18_16225, partial [Methanosarcina sp.]|nr:hypothetical protein [Methanosarcina sp.]
SSAETEDDLLETKQELDALLATASEDIKVILPPNTGPGPGMQNGSEKHFQGFENETERHPEMTANRSQPHGAGNATMDGSGMQGQGPEGMEGKSNLTDENSKETAEESGFFGKLIDALKSLFG